ncbi:MAG: hypothetical protein NVS9B1_01480 [Candidatus Dormibacteraceae bacterium]
MTSPVPPRLVHLNARDNVAVAIRPVAAGETVEVAGKLLLAVDPIPFGHKLALAAMAEGAEVVKYGEVIGRASAPIAAGSHVHVHNVVSARLPGRD